MAEVLTDMLATADTTPWVKMSMGNFDASLSGTWAGTATLQRSYDGGTTALDVEAFTANTEQTGINSSTNAEYRWEFTARTSGTAVGILRQ